MSKVKNRKGIILAGGSGSRLHPITLGVSKQLLPVYDKPMIYYPLSVLMLAGIREVCIITAPDSLVQFKSLLGSGQAWGMDLTYVTQPSPDGLAQAYILAEEFLNGSPSAMVLGDNIFYGSGFTDLLAAANMRNTGGTVFGYEVSNPSQYGVVGFNSDGKVETITEKPTHPASNFAVTGLYFLDEDAPERARKILPSSRGELEITSLLETYLDDGKLTLEIMSRGYAWLDTGTHSSLLDAGNFVRTLQLRQGLQVGCPEEIAFSNGWISADQLFALGKKYGKTEYGKFLTEIVSKHQGLN